MSYGYLDKEKEKNKTLEQLISKNPNSYLADDSLYELGNYFSSIGDYDKAIINYDVLIENHKNMHYI